MLKPTHVSFECLRDKRANMFLLVWQYRTSGIDTGRVRYLPSNGKVVVLGLVCREFRRESGVPAMVGSSDVSRLTDLDGSLSWSYRTCPVWTTRGQRLVFNCLEGWEFRRESRVLTVGSSGMHREFRYLTNFNSVT